VEAGAGVGAGATPSASAAATSAVSSRVAGDTSAASAAAGAPAVAASVVASAATVSGVKKKRVDVHGDPPSEPAPSTVPPPATSLLLSSSRSRQIDANAHNVCAKFTASAAAADPAAAVGGLDTLIATVCCTLTRLSIRSGPT